MAAMFFLPVLPGFSLAIIACLHALMLRLLPRLLPMHALIWAVSLGLGAEISLDLLLTSDAPLGERSNLIAPNVLTFLILCYCYFHFFNLGETGRRIRILIELYQAGGSLTEDQLLQRYGAEELLQQRLLRLERAGQIRLEHNFIHANGASMRIMSLSIDLLKWILGKKTSRSQRDGAGDD